ncbi:hypothetical protein HanIR_Chr14g0727911 [Helianthus annuus]|nr:hypothetical protein HanIR_Chr14g0727911 [Helianthus annuus]
MPPKPLTIPTSLHSNCLPRIMATGKPFYTPFWLQTTFMDMWMDQSPVQQPPSQQPPLPPNSLHSYRGLKGNIVARQSPPAFSELYALLSDHDFLVKPESIPPTQAFTAVTNSRDQQPASDPQPNPTLQALQQLLTHLNLQPTPTQPPSQAFYTNRSGYNRGRGQNNHNNRRGRGSYNNSNNNNNNNNSRNPPNNGNNRNPFPWASTQTTVYGTCNRYGIGHIPSQCPNRDPTTIWGRSPSANYSDVHSQSSTPWRPDTGATNHVAPDLSTFDYSEPYFGGDNLRVGDGQVYTHYPPHRSQQ